MANQASFAPIIRAGLRKDFRDNYMEWSPEYSLYSKVSSITTPEQRAVMLVGLNRLFERGDGEQIIFSDPKMTPVVAGIDKEYAAGYFVTRRTIEDDQYGKMRQGAKMLAKAARLTYEYRAAAVLDDAFTGATFTGIDGLSLCNTAHTVVGVNSATQSNAAATPVTMSVAGITALMDLFQNTKDENGDPIVMWPDLCIVGNSAGDYNRALQIFKSQKEAFTADNQDNAIKMRLPNVEIIVSHYKTSAKSYFLVDRKNNDVHFDIRRPVEIDDEFDFNTDALKFKCSTRFLNWFVDWRGWTGSNPS